MSTPTGRVTGTHSPSVVQQPPETSGQLSPTIDVKAFSPIFNTTKEGLVCKETHISTSPAAWNRIQTLVKSNDNGLGQFTLNIFALIGRFVNWLGLSKTVNQLAESAIKASEGTKEEHQQLLNQFKEINSQDGRLARMILAVATNDANGTPVLSAKELIETFHTLITNHYQDQGEAIKNLLEKLPLNLLNHLNDNVLKPPADAPMSQKSAFVTTFRKELDSEIALKSVPPSPAPSPGPSPVITPPLTGAGAGAGAGAGQTPPDSQPPLPIVGEHNEVGQGAPSLRPPPEENPSDTSSYLPNLEGDDDYHEQPPPSIEPSPAPTPRKQTIWDHIPASIKQPPPQTTQPTPRSPSRKPPQPASSPAATPPQPKQKGPTYADVAKGKAKPQAEAEGWREAKGRGRTFRPQPQGPRQGERTGIAGIPASRNIYDILPIEEVPEETHTQPLPPPATAKPQALTPQPQQEEEWKVVGKGKRQQPLQVPTPRKPPTNENPFSLLQEEEAAVPEEEAAPPKEKIDEPKEAKPSKRQQIKARRLERQAKEKDERAWRKTVQEAFGDMQSAAEIFAERPRQPAPPPPQEEPAVLPPPPSTTEPISAPPPTSARPIDYTGFGLDENELAGYEFAKSSFNSQLSEALRRNDIKEIKTAISRNPAWAAEAMNENETLPSGLKNSGSFSTHLTLLLDVLEQTAEPRVRDAISKIIESKINECKELKQNDPTNMRIWQDIQTGAFERWMQIKGR